MQTAIGLQLGDQHASWAGSGREQARAQPGPAGPAAASGRRCNEVRLALCLAGDGAGPSAGKASKASSTKKASAQKAPAPQLKSREEAMQAAAEAVRDVKPLPLDLGQGLRLQR